MMDVKKLSATFLVSEEALNDAPDFARALHRLIYGPKIIPWKSRTRAKRLHYGVPNESDYCDD